MFRRVFPLPGGWSPSFSGWEGGEILARTMECGYLGTALAGWLLACLLGGGGLPGQPPAPSLGRLALEARSGDPARREAALKALLARGEVGRRVLEEVLRERTGKVRSGLRLLLASGSFRRARSRLWRELLERRKKALEWILDPRSFRKGYGIREMLDRVGKVRELWEKPEVFLRKELKRLGGILEEAGRISRWARAAGGPAGSGLEEECVARIRKAAALEEAGIGKAQVRWNQEVLAWNEKDAPTSADSEEMLVMRSANQYRLMMGMRALEVDERIVRAARKHSIEMAEMGYFSHTSPVKAHADFASRMRQEGYSGPLAENIALARDGRRAFRAWFLSAGHHRNMLLARATAFGVGRSRGRDGSFLWTMNLGAGDSLRGRTLEDPSLLYLQKRRRIGPGDAKAHLALAKWCLAKKLVREMCDQCRAALRIDPSLEEARRLLARRFDLKKR